MALSVLEYLVYRKYYKLNNKYYDDIVSELEQKRVAEI